MALGSHAMPVAPHMMAAAPNGMMHAGRPMGGQPVVGARVGARPSGLRSGSRNLSTSRNTVRSSGTRRRFDSDRVGNDRNRRPECSSGAPGLGFDEVHLAAVCGPGSIEGGLGSSFFFPFSDGGFSVPGAPAVDDAAATTEAQDSEDSEVKVRDRGRRTRVTREEPAPVSHPDVAAARETGEYVFVRKDGTVFFAVAYTWENGTLRYVTNEGLRRSVARDLLDLNATQQFNEQLGSNFRLPA